MRRVIVSAIVLIALVLGIVSPAAGAATVRRDVITDTLAILVPCGTSDEITMSGFVTFVFFTKALPDGGFVMSQRFVAKLSGTDTSGDRYQFSATGGFVEIVFPAGGATYTNVGHTIFTGAGDAPDYAAKVTQHVTLTPNGDIAVRFLFEAWGCF